MSTTSRIAMNPLIDDCYRELFKYVSLNDLMNCRLVSKRFKFLVDSMRIKKLAIFQGAVPRPGKFQLLDEHYDLSDCVHVLNLDSFFKSKTIMKCLEKVEKLRIAASQYNEKNFFKVQFNELTFLEIFGCTIVHPTVLASPKLKKIYYSQVLMNANRVDSQSWSRDLPSSALRLGFDKVVSKQLKHINFRSVVNQDFFEYCDRRGLLDEIEVIEVQLFDLESLLNVVRKCPKLKKIDACVGRPPADNKSVKEVFCDRFTDEQLRTTASKLKRMSQRLSVFLWSLPFNLTTCERVRRFYSELNDAVKVQITCLELRISTDRVYQLFRQFDRDNFLDNFWSNVLAVFDLKVADEARFCERLTNCITISTRLNKESDLAIVKEAIRSLPRLEDVYFPCEYTFKCGNDVLDLLPKHHKYLTGLSLEYWNPISFDFLFGMVGLKYLQLFLMHPMPSSTFLDLIRTQKHLAYFQVYFERLEDQTKEKLSAFKAEVIECLEKELGYKDAVFKINTFCHTVDNKQVQVVRYAMKRNKLSIRAEGCLQMDPEKRQYLNVLGSIMLSKSLPLHRMQI